MPSKDEHRWLAGSRLANFDNPFLDIAAEDDERDDRTVVFLGKFKSEPQWSAAIHVTWRKDRFDIVRVTLMPSAAAEKDIPDAQGAPSGGMAASFIRSIRWSDAFTEARFIAATDAAVHRGFGPLHETRLRREMGVPAVRDDLSSRPGLAKEPRELAKLARDYVQLSQQGERHPTKRLAAVLNYSPVTINERIRAARKAKLLTAAPRGKAGGRLTARAKKLLEGIDNG